VKVVSIVPGDSLPQPAAALAGAVLARHVVVDGVRWSKGRRLDEADLRALEGGDVTLPGVSAASADAPARAITLLIPEPGDVHEDVAAARLAAAVAGPGLAVRGPNESRFDLVAAHPGEVRVRVPMLERLNAIDGIAVFTLLDGQLVAEGTLVASVKTGPHLIPAASLVRAEATAVRAGPGRPVVEVRPYVPRRIAAVVKETLAAPARARFEATLRARVEGLASTLVEVCYVADEAAAVASAFRRLARGREPVDLVLTAGAASTDPADAVFAGFAAVGGRVVSHGVPAHPGSMLWLGRAGATTFLGLPTCGSYSRATAADLLLPWLVAGDAPDRRTAARLAHGGILAREMRFRFPPYARALDAPEG
jgi:molybdenum cofactor cytidylyltransferase